MESDFINEKINKHKAQIEKTDYVVHNMFMIRHWLVHTMSQSEMKWFKCSDIMFK